MSTSDQLVTWLNSAYSMEQSLLSVLENHARDSKDFPEINRQLEQHREETRRHADRVKDCLQLLQRDALLGEIGLGPGQRNGPGRFDGRIQRRNREKLSCRLRRRDFEIACYTSLIAAAEELGKPEIAEICRGILKDEQAMADWLADEIPTVTRTFLETQVANT